MTTETIDNSVKVASLAAIINSETPALGVDLELLQKVVPGPLAAAILRLGETCLSIDRRMAAAEAGIRNVAFEPDPRLLKRVMDLEKEVLSLKAIATAQRGPCPITDRGMTVFPAGDPIPSKSNFDLLEGNVYTFPVGGVMRPMRLTKNTSGSRLKRGETYFGGIVDTQLRRDEVELNDFFLLEV